MRYYWKKQKLGSTNCGQIAVSIILHKSLKETVKMFGHSSYSTTKDMVKILRKNKVKCDNRLKRKRGNLAIAKLTYPYKRNWHWVVVWGDKIYDGHYGRRNGTVRWDCGTRITSYLNIKEK